MQRGEAAHGQAYDMRRVQAQMLEHVAGIVHGAHLAVAVGALGHVRGRIAARVKHDAAIVAREILDLLLPGAQIVSEFMDEKDRRAGASFFVIELYTVVRNRMRHGLSPPG